MIGNSLRGMLEAKCSTLRLLLRFGMALQMTTLCGCTSATGSDDTYNPGKNDGGSGGAVPSPSGTGGAPSTGTTGTTNPGMIPGSSPVAKHGRLKVVSNQITDQNGEPVQFKGMSLFWSQWAGVFYNASVIDTLADEWHATLVRAAMGVEQGGYLENPAAERDKVKIIVDAATAKGIYVIIDWHDHNATQHPEQAKAFFSEMAKLYGKQPNVIFEIFNEPVDQPWDQIKSYAETVIGVIRGEGSENLVVVGTPRWSQDVDTAASNPITQFSNIAYTLHFYAGTHKQFLRDKAKTALSKGLALFSTEWGTCDASGNGGLNLDESQTWLNFLNENKISWANWSLFDKPETASALVQGADPKGGWKDQALTESGKFAKAKIGEGK